MSQTQLEGGLCWYRDNLLVVQKEIWSALSSSNRFLSHLSRCVQLSPVANMMLFKVPSLGVIQLAPMIGL